MTDTSIPVSEAAELKPCPFCGGKPELVTNAPERWVHCLKCKASGNTFTHESTAVEKWNLRSTAATGSRDREGIPDILLRFAEAFKSGAQGATMDCDDAKALADAILSLNPVGADGGAVREALQKITNKIEQLQEYRDTHCQLEHAKAIADGRIAQAKMDATWIREALSSLLEPGRSDVQKRRHNEPVGHALSAETKSGSESSSREIEVLRKLAFGLTPAAQYRLAFFIAENVGYVLEREPPHPDCPHEREQADGDAA